MKREGCDRRTAAASPERPVNANVEVVARDVPGRRNISGTRERAQMPKTPLFVRMKHERPVERGTGIGNAAAKDTIVFD